MSLKSSLFDLAAKLNSPTHKPLFIIGHGRSGTTWVGDTFAQHQSVLYYNEPTRFGFKEKERKYGNFLSYVADSANADYFKDRLDASMGGFFLTDSAVWFKENAKIKRRLTGKYRVVIKDVATIMSIEWVYRTYSPDVLIIYRHPCSVALSEIERDIDIDLTKRILLGNKQLFNDHLEPYRSLIEKAQKPYEVYAAVYGARNKVLTNFEAKHKIKQVLLYEDLASDPIKVFPEIFSWYGLDFPEQLKTYVSENTSNSKEGFYTTTKKSSDHKERWKRKMSAEEAEQVAEFILPYQLPYYNKPEDFKI